MDEATAVEVVTTAVEVSTAMEVMAAAMTVAVTMTMTATSGSGRGQCNRGYGDRGKSESAKHFILHVFGAECLVTCTVSVSSP